MDSLRQALVDILGNDKVVVDRNELARYCADGLRPSRAWPRLADMGRLMAQPAANTGGRP